jgi:hypothetical protein
LTTARKNETLLTRNEIMNFSYEGQIYPEIVKHITRNGVPARRREKSRNLNWK